MVMVDEAGLGGVPVADLVGRVGVAWNARQALIDHLTQSDRAIEIGSVLVATGRLSAAADVLLGAVARYHASHPLEDGMPREEIRERIFATAAPAVFEWVLNGLTEGKRIVARDRVALAGHTVALTDEEAHAREAMIEILREAALAPPDPAALAARIAIPLDVVNRIATLLVRRAILVRTGDLLFHESALRQLKTEIQSLKQSGTAETIDVGSFKDRYNVTRKYAIPLLEYLDRERVTGRGLQAVR